MLKKLIKEKLTSLTFKLLPEELQVIKKNADKYTGGNVSAWMREAALNYKPRKEDLA